MTNQNKWRSAVTLLSIAFVFASCQENIEEPNITRIAFGSCASQEMENKMWPSIQAHEPSVFIWLGDNIYGDSEDPNVLSEKYERQKNQPAYQDFLSTGVEVIGTWDDHDYGLNDMGKEHSAKAESKAAMLSFLDVSKDAVVQNIDGVYQSYTFGEGEQKVKVLLLDTRWFRDSLAVDTSGNGKYMTIHEGTLLGERQWAWFEKELTISDAQVHIIGSSIQAISEEHGWEKWGNFPHELDRLYDVINETNVPNPIIISGDRHLAEISARELPNGGMLYDVTSSGLTHVFVNPDEEPNEYRVGPFIQKRNWGLLQINWDAEQPEISVEIRGEADSLFLKQTLSF